MHDTATLSSAAYVPHPGSGESPTRPGIWFVMPPVDVPAATCPAASLATAPIVPCFSQVSPSDWARASERRRSSVPKYDGSRKSMPPERSISSPGSANIVCLARSLTARATSIGCRAVVSPAAEPTSPSPVIRQASIDTFPSLVSAAPRPALNSGASSIT